MSKRLSATIACATFLTSAFAWAMARGPTEPATSSGAVTTDAVDSYAGKFEGFRSTAELYPAGAGRYTFRVTVYAELSTFPFSDVQDEQVAIVCSDATRFCVPDASYPVPRGSCPSSRLELLPNRDLRLINPCRGRVLQLTRKRQ